jgi:serine protease Do
MRLFPLLLGVLAAHVALADDAQRRRPEVERAIAKMSPTIVRIEVISEDGADGRMLRQHAVGSGAIIDAEGHVVTNYHVAGRGATFLCRLADREELPATLVGADAMTDVAVIKLDLSRRRAQTPLPVAAFADSDKVRVGDTVLSMGCPAGLTQSVTLGIVANDAMVMTRFVGGMNLDGESVGELVRWFGHDAVIFGGNSGGPLVDTDGRIAGINEIGVGSLGGAIPANTAQAVVAELIHHGRVVRGWTGADVQPMLRSRTVKGERGVLVRGALEGSPAAAAGLRQGDVIVAVAGQETAADCDELMPAFHRLVSALRPGVEVPFVVRRGGQTLTVPVKPIEREANEAREIELTSWGLTVRSLTRMGALHAKRPDTKGVLVDSLRNGGPAAEAKPGLMEGDILLSVAGRPVADAPALRQVTRELLKDKTEPEPLLVAFARGNAQMISVVRVGPEVDPAIAPRAPKPWAGMSTQVLTAEIAKALNLKGKAGVRITQVLPGSNAEQAGLKVGDLLLKLDGKVIPARRPEDSEVFAALLREYPVGTDVQLDALRDGQPLAVTLHLAELPATPSELPTVKDTRFGFSARQLGYDDKVQRKVAAETQGVIVTKVERSGWADLSGLRSGDIVHSINGQPVSDNVTLRAALTRLAADKPRHVVFQVRRSLSGAYLEFEPDWSAFESTK